jgi:serine/threonine protein kinase
MSGLELDNISGNGHEPNQAATVTRVPLTARPAFRGEIAALSTRFECLSKIRNSGNIASFLARNLSARAGGALVVLEVFDSFGAESRQLELFRLEAEAAAGLSHRNILRSSLNEEIDGIHFSILEHRPGAETLRDLLDRHGWLDVSLAIGLVQQVADALEYAHSSGILHLKIHPGNILIDPDGTAVLADFGLEARSELAWAHQERTSHSPVHYISPEQAGGKPVDARSDLYSLGVVLYQMLTDRLPLDSIDSESVRQKHLTQSPLSAHLYLNDIPYSVSNIITRMLEKDPAKRFADAATLREALDSSLKEIIGGSEDVLLLMEEDEKIEDIENVEDTKEYERLEQSYRLIDGYDFDQSVTLAIAQVRDACEQPAVLAATLPTSETELESPSEESAASERASAPPLLTPRFTNASSSEPSSAGFRWQPLLLVFALSIAVVIGVIGLALADRAKNSRPVSAEAPARDGKLDRASSLPVTGNEKSSVGNEQSITNNHLENSSSKSGVARARPAVVTSSPLRNTQRRITIAATAQRPRIAKKKVRRASRNAVHYRASNRRYSRARER